VVSALINLLDNALKYTPDDKRLVVRATRMDGGVAFEVQDNGIGIAPREQRRIFRRFYRVDQRLASATSGVGLGLSIVELIARAHGGSVTVQSAEGSGSTFTLYVPMAVGVAA
jgi:two-component system sensor histidine kinase SenX3